MVKILAEAAFGYRRGKVDMGGREDAHVYAHLAVATEAFEADLLQEAQQRSLRIHRQVADLVQEQGPAVRHLDAPQLALRRTGERAAFVAQTIGLPQGFR